MNERTVKIMPQKPYNPRKWRLVGAVLVGVPVFCIVLLVWILNGEVEVCYNAAKTGAIVQYAPFDIGGFTILFYVKDYGVSLSRAIYMDYAMISDAPNIGIKSYLDKGRIGFRRQAH